MRASVAVVLVGLCGVAVAAPAHAAPTRNLYMVKGVGSVDGIYYGEFAALAKTGSTVVGAVGAFSSEYVCIKGKVKNGKLAGQVYENGVPVTSFSRKWVGTGSQERIKGMKRISAATATMYLDGVHPKSFIADCQAMIAGGPAPA